MVDVEVEDEAEGKRAEEEEGRGGVDEYGNDWAIGS